MPAALGAVFPGGASGDCAGRGEFIYLCKGGGVERVLGLWGGGSDKLGRICRGGIECVFGFGWGDVGWIGGLGRISRMFVTWTNRLVGFNPSLLSSCYHI